MNPSPLMPSPAILERFLLGELPPARMEELRKLRDSDPAFRARLEALLASNARILEDHPPGQAARGIEARRGAPGTGDRAAPARSIAPAARPAPSHLRLLLRFRFRYAGPAFAMLALALVLGLHTERAAGKRSVMSGTEADTVRLKGAEAGLAVFRKTRGGSELLAPQSSARPGDTLQVFYRSRTARYGMVFSVDGAGSITLHFPETEGPAAPLQAGDMQPLPHAFRLDKAPRLERFFLITSPGPFSCESMLALARTALRPGGAVPDSLSGLPEGFRQYPYTIRKAEAK